MKYLFIYKKHNTILCIIFFNTIFSYFNLFSQSTSPGIFFQAIARDNYTNPAKDRTIFVQSSIIKGAALGNKVFTEIQTFINDIREEKIKSFMTTTIKDFDTKWTEEKITIIVRQKTII